MASEHGSKTVIYAALVGNALIAVTKFAASAYTGSSAMLSEAIHSVVDTGNQVLLLYGMKRASRPADAAHPFGHGRELYFWAFVVAILIFAVGSGISTYEGIQKIRHPHVVTNPIVNYIVLGLAMVFEGVAFAVALRELNRVRGEMPILKAVRLSKNPAVFTVLFEDFAALSGLVVALVGLVLAEYLEQPWLDGAASVGIGVILGATAVFLAYETKALLIGEAASDEVVAGIRAIVGEEAPAVIALNELRTMHMGADDILVGLSVDFRDDLAAGTVEDTIYRIERAIKERFPEVKRLYIEVQSVADHIASVWESQSGAPT